MAAFKVGGSAGLTSIEIRTLQYFWCYKYQQLGSIIYVDCGSKQGADDGQIAEERYSRNLFRLHRFIDTTEYHSLAIVDQKLRLYLACIDTWCG